MWNNIKATSMSDPVINERGTKVWYVYGKRHRVDGPAVEYADGSESWWVDGKLHRVSGPAIEYANGSKAWFVDGKRHRVDGPAVIYAGNKEWFVYGKRHRVDGPAVICADGTKEWYVRNLKYMSAKAFQLAANLSDEEIAKVILKHGNVG